MRKLAFQVGEDIHEEKPRSRVPLVLLSLLLLVGLGPLALEGGAVCVGYWKEFMGESADVRTPVLDQLQDSMHDASDVFWAEIRPYFRRLPWDPKMVLPAATIIMAVAMFMLRR